MNDYHEGRISLDELQRETEPRYLDAIEGVDDIIAAIRLTSNGEVVVQHDVLWQEEAGQPIDVDRLQLDGLYYYADVVRQGSDTVLLNVTAAAAITNQHNEVIGHDVLVFTVDSLLRIVIEENSYTQSADYCLVDRTTGALVRFDGCPEGQLELGELADVAPGLDLSKQEIYELRSEGTRYLIFSTPLANSDWTLLVRIPSFNLYEGLVLQLFWLSVVLFVLVLAGAWYMRLNLKPILSRISEQNRQLVIAGQVFDRANEAIVVTDFQLRIVRINPAGRRMLSLVGKNSHSITLDQFFSTDRIHPDFNRKVLRELINHDVWQGEVWYKLADGSEFPALQTVTAVKTDDGEIVQLIHIFNDITKQKGEQEAIRRQAVTDDLTGLPNRAGLNVELKQCMSKAQLSDTGFALLFMDLDKFKPVNDTYGHALGDKLLQAIEPRLKTFIRSSDIVARIGGDEFVIVLCGASELDFVCEVADKVVAAMNEPFEVDGLTVQIGASVGIAVYPQHGNNQDDLLKAADKAMYMAKEKGRNRSEVAG